MTIIVFIAFFAGIPMGFIVGSIYFDRMTRSKYDPIVAEVFLNKSDELVKKFSELLDAQVNMKNLKDHEERKRLSGELHVSVHNLYGAFHLVKSLIHRIISSNKDVKQKASHTGRLEQQTKEMERLMFTYNSSIPK